MGWLLVIASIFATCIAGVALVRKVDQHHPNNGREISRNLTRHSDMTIGEKFGH